MVEPLSLDEAFLDATESVSLFDSVETIGRAIKQDTRKKLKLNDSEHIRFALGMMDQESDTFLVIDC